MTDREALLARMDDLSAALAIADAAGDVVAASQIRAEIQRAADELAEARAIHTSLTSHGGIVRGAGATSATTA